MTIAKLIEALMCEACNDPKVAEGIEVLDEKGYPIEFVHTENPLMTVRVSSRRPRSF